MIITRRLATIIQLLRQGGVIAYPTEAVWGLGCDPANDFAVGKLLQLKQRMAAKGLILVAGDWQQLQPWLTQLTLAQQQLLAHQWPGFCTWLIPNFNLVSKLICGEHDSVALRLTAHMPTAKLARAFGQPLVSTSANLHQQPPARDIATICQQFGNQLAGIWLAPLGYQDNPSAIYDLMTGKQLRD